MRTLPSETKSKSNSADFTRRNDKRNLEIDLYGPLKRCQQQYHCTCCGVTPFYAVDFLITGLPYVAIQSKNASHFSVFPFFLSRKMEKLRNSISPVAPLVSTVPVL